jgi:transposase
MENLTDRQAADAVRSRLDWKYALSLELTDPGFDHTVLSEFRTHLVALTAEERFLEAVLALCKEQGWLKARGRQRTDSTHVLAKIRALNRAECVVETLRHALNVLAVAAPDWLRSQVQPDWLERYGHRADEYRFPSGTDKRQQFLHQVGQDGWNVLAAIEAQTETRWMLSIPAVDTLQRIWKQNYLPLEEGGTWIADEDRLEAARLFYSPYDLDASAAKKRSTYWIGYKAHFTETCEEDLPLLITQVTTTIGPTPDGQALPDIHAVLDRRELLPEQHLVDAGYVDAELLVASQTEYQVDLVGPTGKDHRWQAREQTGYALPAISPLIGSRSKHVVRKAVQAAVGRRPRLVTKMSSRSSLLIPPVDLVQCDRSGHSQSDAPSRCDGVKPMKRLRQLVNESKPRNLRRCTLNEQG